MQDINDINQLIDKGTTIENTLCEYVSDIFDFIVEHNLMTNVLKDMSLSDKQRLLADENGYADEYQHELINSFQYMSDFIYEHIEPVAEFNRLNFDRYQTNVFYPVGAFNNTLFFGLEHSYDNDGVYFYKLSYKEFKETFINKDILLNQSISNLNKLIKQLFSDFNLKQYIMLHNIENIF